LKEQLTLYTKSALRQVQDKLLEQGDSTQDNVTLKSDQRFEMRHSTAKGWFDWRKIQLPRLKEEMS